jgi:hypothetical protein
MPNEVVPGPMVMASQARPRSTSRHAGDRHLVRREPRATYGNVSTGFRQGLASVCPPRTEPIGSRRSGVLGAMRFLKHEPLVAFGRHIGDAHVVQRTT